jgi:hypothetical protein
MFLDLSTEFFVDAQQQPLNGRRCPTNESYRAVLIIIFASDLNCSPQAALKRRVNQHRLN